MSDSIEELRASINRCEDASGLFGVAHSLVNEIEALRARAAVPERGRLLLLVSAIAAMQPATDKLRTKRIRVKNWTLLHQFWLVSAYPRLAGWLRDEGLVPWISVRGANLQGANLYGADLYGANLYGANLRGASLQGANYPIGDVPDGWTRGADGCLTRDGQ